MQPQVGAGAQLVKLNFVKLQSKLNSSVQVGQGVDFVFPPSQQEEQEQEQEQEPSPKSQLLVIRF